MARVNLHTLVCLIETLYSIGFIIHAYVAHSEERKWEDYRWYGLALLFGLPVVNEFLLTFKWILCSCRFNKCDLSEKELAKFPIVFAPTRYNIKCFGLEKCHKFYL